MQTLNLDGIRIIDVSRKIVPLKAPFSDEEVFKRSMADELIFPLEKRLFPPDHTTSMMATLKTHLFTHAEAPCHYFESGGKTLIEFPLTTWMGRMVFFNLHLKPRTPLSYEVLEKADKGRLKENDILILTTGFPPETDVSELPLLTPETADFMVSKKVKLFCFDRSVWYMDPLDETSMKIHDTVFKNDIPMLEQLCNLDKLQQDISFFIGFPGLKVEGIDASPVQAIVIEGTEVTGTLGKVIS